MNGKRNRIELTAGAALLLSAIVSLAAHAAVITVNSTVDAPATATALSSGLCADASGACTLRAAVQAADLAPAATTIIVPAGTYNLGVSGVDEAPSSATSANATVVHVPDPSVGDLNITKSMAIIGAGPGQTVIQWDPAVSRVQRDRVFHVEPVDADIAVRIEGVTVANGYVPPPVVLTTMSPTKVVEFMRFGGGIASGSAATVETVNPQATHGQGSGGAGSEGHGEEGGESESGYVVDQLVLSGVNVLDNETGSDGGGIYSAAPLLLEESIVSGNVAGANGGGLYNDGALTMSGTTIGSTAAFATGNQAENGGGIFDTGFHSSDIVMSAITGNSATGGGGIAGRRLVLENITNSTIANNTAQDTGGGITTNGRVVLTNATVAGNIITSDAEGGGAGLNGFGPAAGGSTGGGASGANYTLVNTILSGNVLQGATTVVANCGGTGEGAVSNRFASLGHNLENGDTCGFSGNGDLVNTDPLLKPLAGNGGRTQTMALSSAQTIPADAQTSPAIDAGANAYCPNNDQRGQLRPADGNLDGAFVCDIGAFELFIPSADLHVNNMSAPDSVFVGDSFKVRMEIHVDPAATAASQGIQFATDALPSDLRLDKATVTTASGTSACTESAGVVTCSAGTLQPDDIATMELTLTALNPASALTVTGHVSQTQPVDPDPANNTASVRVEALGLSDLGVTASGDTGPVDVGAETDLPFTVSNAGPNDAGPVSFGVAIPAGVTYKTISIANGSCDAADPTALLCTIANIPANESASGMLTVTGASEGLADVVFGAYAPQRDDNPGNDAATVSLTIRGLADLAVAGGFDKKVAVRETDVPISLTVDNKGPTDATNTVAVTQLPKSLAFVSGAAGSGCSASGATVTCDVGTLPAGNSAALHFTVKVDAPVGTTVTVTSTVGSDKTDPNTGNNGVTSSVSVIGFSSGGGGASSLIWLGLLAAVLAIPALRRHRRPTGGER